MQYSKPASVGSLRFTSILLVSAVSLTACQSGSGSQTAALDEAATPPEQTATDVTTTPPTEADVSTTQNDVETAAQTDQQATIETVNAAQPAPASAPTITPTAAQCTIQLAGGPPAKPPRGKDFGRAVAKNTGKAVQRGVIQQIGGAVGGGLGAAIAGNVARGTIRQEEDIKGVWKITDGTPNCACEISVDSIWKLKGKGADSGFSKNRGCSNPIIQQVAAWTLGYSFTGYDSKFELKAKDKQTVLATLNRDGIHYFSGTLNDGTPIVLWRDRQTYHQLSAFNKSVK